MKAVKSCKRKGKIMSKIKSKILIERWKNDTVWRRRWECIASWMFGVNEDDGWMEEVGYTEKGYLDLRGFPISLHVDLKEYTYLKKEELMPDPRGLITNKRFEKVDFSFADFTGRFIGHCEFIECIFSNTVMCDITESECSFVDCVFTKGIYGGTLGLGGGSYKNVKFQTVKMYKTLMFWPDFEDCLFQNCNLRGTDFGGSHFKNVKFIGKVDHVWFRGKYEASESGKYRESRYDRWSQITPMEVDFSEASLKYIAVSDFCDLSKVILPKDGSCYVIRDFEEMRKDIRKRQSRKEEKLLEIMMKFALREYDGERMGILCMNDMHRYIEKYIDEVDRQRNYDLLIEICDELLQKGILTLGVTT